MGFLQHLSITGWSHLNALFSQQWYLGGQARTVGIQSLWWFLDAWAVMLRTTGEWAGTCVSLPTVSVLQQPPRASSCLSSLQTDHRHLPQPVLLLKGMLSRNTGLKKVKFACSCSVLSVPLSISGIKCLLLGVRFCLCLAPSCQHSPVPWSLSLPRLVPPLYPFPTPLAGVSSPFEVEWISTKEITDKKYTLAPSKLQRRNWLPDVSIQFRLGTLSVQRQATFCHKYLSFIKIFSQRKELILRYKYYFEWWGTQNKGFPSCKLSFSQNGHCRLIFSPYVSMKFSPSTWMLTGQRKCVSQANLGRETCK